MKLIFGANGTKYHWFEFRRNNMYEHIRCVSDSDHSAKFPLHMVPTPGIDVSLLTDFSSLFY